MMISIFSGVLITLLIISLLSLLFLFIGNFVIVNDTNAIWEKHEDSVISTNKLTKDGKEIFRGLDIGDRGLYFVVTGDSRSPRYNYVEFLKRSIFTNYLDFVVGFLHSVNWLWLKRW